MATPWFAAVSWQSPGFLEQFIVTHHLRRFAGAFHDRPIWYFLPVLIVAIHPWSFLPLPYAHFLFSSNDDARRRRPQTIGFLLLWSTWCVFFFSLSRCKLPSYILPSIPAFALLIGHYLDHALFRCLTGAWADYVRRRSAWSAAAATCVAGLGLCLFTVFAEFESPYVGLPLAFACIAGLVAAVVAGRRPSRPLTGWAVSATAAATLACVVLHREIPRYAAARTVFGPESAFSGVGDAYSVPVATIAHEWAETPFYLRDRLVQNFGRLGDPALHAYLSQHRRVLLVVHKDADLADLVQRPSARVALNPIGERGRAKLVLVELTAERADVARTNRSLTHR
jgi:dolichol-phosphate mannosyltransferase